MEQKLIREVLTVTTKNLTSVDKEVGARFNQIAMLALDQAERYILFGPENSRLAITKQFLTATSRLSAADAEEAISVARDSFLRLTKEITNVTPHLTDVESEAITARAYDQDD